MTQRSRSAGAPSTPRRGLGHLLGQSTVEFALSSVVLILLVGGLVDIGRAVYVSDALSSAVREGARHGIWFNAATSSNPYLNNAAIQGVVDQELAAISLPASVLKTSPSTCPTPSDGNVYHNPPYTSTFSPAAPNQAWLYICYNNTPGQTGASSQQDLNVIILYSYGPLTPVISSNFGNFPLAANEHMTVQG